MAPRKRTESQFGADSSDSENLLGLLPKDGSSISNKKLREQLGWDEERYWQVRNHLLSDGKLVLGKGRGGTVSLASTKDESTQAAKLQDVPSYPVSVQAGRDGGNKAKSFLVSTLGRLASVLGGLIAVAFFGGLFFYQCVYPFIREAPSQSWTCSSQEMREFCEDPYTLAGFMAEICGADEVTFTGTYVQVVLLGEPGTREPGILELTVRCPDFEATWEIEEGREMRYLKDAHPKNAGAERVVKALDDYSLGEIDLATARYFVLQDR